MSESDTHLHYLRHKNGRGRLFELSEACRHSLLDRHSVAQEESSIWRSRIEASLITGSTVSDSVVRASSLIYTNVHGATIERSIVACEFVGQNARITDSELTGKTRVSGAIVENVRASNVAILSGVVCRDWPEQNVDFAHGYITRGVWTRPPRVFRISPTITMTESVPGFVHVHCREYEIHHLLRIGRRLGRQCNWTDVEILTIRRALHHLLNGYRPRLPRSR